MTHTDPTAAALLRGVLLHPECDAARLVFADRLDDLGQHERAELIRVQIEWERADTAERATALVDRANELLTDARRRAWSGIKCPVCGGSGEFDGGAMGSVDCHACNPVPWGPGAIHNLHFGGTGLAPVEFRRGFVESVRCRMEDVLQFVPPKWGNPPTHELTPWARGVLAAHPVTRWEIADIDDNPPGRDSLMIWLGIQYAESGGRLADNEPFPRCVGRVARRLAGLPEATP